MRFDFLGEGLGRAAHWHAHLHLGGGGACENDRAKEDERNAGMHGLLLEGCGGAGAGWISDARMRRSGDQMRSGGRGGAVVPGADASGGWLCASIAVSCALVVARTYGMGGDAGTCTGAVLVQAGAWLTPRPFAPGSGQCPDWLGQQECAQACAGHTGTQTMARTRRMARYRAAGRTARMQRTGRS
jgi:hypothetical protein